MSKKIDLGWLPYVLILLGIICLAALSMVSYMSLNNWDVRCVFVECKPVKIVGDEE